MKTKYVCLFALCSLTVISSNAHADGTNTPAKTSSTPTTNAVTPYTHIQYTDETMFLALTSKPEVSWVKKIIENSHFDQEKSTEWRREENIFFRFPSLADFEMFGHFDAKLSPCLKVDRPVGVVYPPIHEQVLAGLCLSFALEKWRK